ncbi:MAG TPA: hypothetical protein VHU40_19115 [Polyangia bacterium]|nr:hypothetical protein [Polyangia bacterium]
MSPPEWQLPQSEPVAAAPAIGSNRWYGWQLLLADVSFIALLKLGAEADSSAAVTAGAMGLTLGAPVLHGLNGNLRMGATSFAVRGMVTLGAAGLLSGTRSTCAPSDTACELGHAGVSLGSAFMAVGLILGGVVFAAVEDVGLSTTTALPVWQRPASPPSFTVAPTLAPTVTQGAGATFTGVAGGLVGTF